MVSAIALLFPSSSRQNQFTANHSAQRTGFVGLPGDPAALWSWISHVTRFDRMGDAKRQDIVGIRATNEITI
jgi:hypothetical protein